MVLLQWLMAKPKHVKKYAELYIDHGYDVIAVNVTPWQVMWPTKGTQVSVKRPMIFFRIDIILRFVDVDSWRHLR